MLSEWDDTPWAGSPVAPGTAVRVVDGSAVDFALRVTGLGLRTSTWRIPTVREALGVPAIFRSVAMISNTTGALSMDAWRRGVKLDPDDRPRLIVRPDPFKTPHKFYRNWAWNKATRGESWAWIAKRDSDGNPMSLILVPPHEIVVREDPNDLRYPIIEWRGKRMPNRDMIQDTFAEDPDYPFRGVGPLQLCGVAVSVTVEAEEWAANFYSSGGHPSLLIKSAQPLGTNPEILELTDDEVSEAELARSEAELIRNQWVDKPNNVPRVIDPSIESVEYMAPNPAGAAMLEARERQVAEAIRMFGVPAGLLNYAVQGASLTYQNVQQELDKFTRVCLWPDYLEGIEQEISDLLPNSTVARFNIDALTRADPKTRWETYEIMVAVLGPDEAASIAREREGIDPGDVEVAPVAPAPPAAIPASFPSPVTLTANIRTAADIRCDGLTSKRRSGVSRMETCGKLLSTTGEFVGQCPRCKKAYPVAA